MYLHEEAIKALIEYRKRNGYTKEIHLTASGAMEKPLDPADIPF